MLAIVFLSGCTGTPPITQISTFADSTKALSEKINSVIDEYNDESLNRQYTNYASTFTGKHASLLTSKKLLEITRPMTAEQKKSFAIYKANKSIGRYAESLARLADANSLKDLDLASANLYGSMTTLNDQYRKLKGVYLFSKDSWATSSKFFEGIRGVITQVGSRVLEKKRREAIKGIVLESDAKIALICDEIITQLETLGIEDALSASRQYVLSEEISDYKFRIKSIDSLQERRVEIKRLHKLQQQVINSKLLVQQTIRAVKQIKSSHSVLARELKKDKFISTSISTEIGQLKNLEANYGDFESFLFSCQNRSKNEKGILSCDDR